MPEALADLIVVVPFNDPVAFEKAIAAHGNDLAAVIVEPISYNQGCIPARPEFLRLVRETCTRLGIVLIFDEVLSGFRMCRGGLRHTTESRLISARWPRPWGAASPSPPSAARPR